MRMLEKRQWNKKRLLFQLRAKVGFCVLGQRNQTPNSCCDRKEPLGCRTKVRQLSSCPRLIGVNVPCHAKLVFLTSFWLFCCQSKLFCAKNRLLPFCRKLRFSSYSHERLQHIGVFEKSAAQRTRTSASDMLCSFYSYIIPIHRCLLELRQTSDFL